MISTLSFRNGSPLGIGLVLFACVAGRVGATEQLWLNQTTYYGPPPQIDAYAFSNEGDIRFFLQPPQTPSLTIFPFETLNTLYYTNRGAMFSELGIRFDNHGDGYERRPANTVVNTGQLVSEDSVGTTTFNGVVVPSGGASSLIDISATNLVNRGLLETGESGKMLLSVRNLDLQRSGLRVAQSARGELPQRTYSDFVVGNFYQNAPNVTDFYWAIGTNNADLTASSPTGGRLFDYTEFWGPQHLVTTNISGGGVAVYLPGPFIRQSGYYDWETPANANYEAFTYENSVNGTNLVFSTVIVPTSARGGQITAQVGFWRLAAGFNTNGVALAAGHPIVRLNVRLQDPILGTLDNPIYVYDLSLYETNNILATNRLDDLSRRPLAYRVGRADPLGFWTNRHPANAFYDYNTYVWNPGYSNLVVQMNYSAYAASFNAASSTIISNLFALSVPESGIVNTNPYAPLALFDPTNRIGRMELKSEANIDLRKTRVYSANYLKISAPHVIHDDYTVLDAPYMSLTFGSTNGTLKVDNLVPNTVERLEGRLFLHTSVWTNSVLDQSGSNYITTLHHVLIVDPEDLVATKDVVMFETDLKSDNLVISDRIRTTRKLTLDATNIVINAGGALQPTLETKDLGGAQLPRLVTFTNYSTNSLVQGTSSFGYSPAKRLATWFNQGLWLGFAHKINSTTIRNSGRLIASRGVNTLEADVVDLRGGTLSSQLDNRIKAKEFLASGAAISAGGFLSYTQFVVNVPGGLVLDVSDKLDDGGAGQNNLWKVSGGINMVRKPTEGDLLGTRITSTGKGFEIVRHTWAGEDRGPVVSGYSNNMALQRLTLDGEALTLFTFEPATGNNALYVEYLELRNGVQDVLYNLEIQPGMRIYFGDANLSPALLDGLFDGRLVYLPNSAAATVQLAGDVSNARYRVELVTSMTVDSDGDGIVNGLDSNPFDGVRIFVEAVEGDGGTSTVVWWNGAPRTEYSIQFKNGLSDQWHDLKKVYSGPEGGIIGALDATGIDNRFYRVNYIP